MSCLYLFPLIVLRWMNRPHRLTSTDHANLIISLVISAADLVDFIEYVNIKDIVVDLNGVDSIIGKLSYTDVYKFIILNNIF